MKIPYKAVVTLPALACAILIMLATCDRSSEPVEDYHFVGITQTDATGVTIGSPDADDWCESSVGPGNIPNQYALWPAFPNPAVGSITVRFGLPVVDSVEVYILAWPERKVRSLVNGSRSAGSFGITWDLRDDDGDLLKPDIYRCVMRTGTFICHGDILIPGP